MKEIVAHPQFKINAIEQAKAEVLSRLAPWPPSEAGGPKRPPEPRNGPRVAARSADRAATALIRARSSLPASRFQHCHDLLHLVRVVEHPPRRPQTLLPPDAEKVTGAVTEFAA